MHWARVLVERRLFVCVAGFPGAGKGVVVDVARRLGLPVFVMGDVVREEVRRRGLEPTVENLMKVANELRKVYGPNAIAVKTVEKVLATPHKLVVIDGVRSPYELEVFRQHGTVVVVWVEASLKTRFERLSRRGRPGDPKTIEELKYRDSVEEKWGLGLVRVAADFTIVNEGGLEEARRLAELVWRVLLYGVRES
ncbi:MAG TPA: dephospho-CoA kinase [Pyrodictium sp.]|nr:dephospho-CoA kinase [Pyrodictium sp.]